MSDSVRVAVRVRPFIHDYEKVEGIRNIVRMDRGTQQTFLMNPETGKEKGFAFDFSYNSFVPEDHPEFASQETVWQDLGVDVLDNAWKGFNVSLFAYGQTGAGKSHSMMGYPGAEGIVPRACRKIFERIAETENPNVTFKVESSMLEIYNEKIRDLFNPGGDNGRGLKVRDHPKKGPYVQNLTKMAVGSYDEISKAMETGTKARTVAATAMNASSSRAHTIFQVILTQTTVDRDSGQAMDKVSIISLIDLAGSERADRTGASGDRLKEGCAINQSLSALGNVISALAEQTTNPKKKVVVPYRDSCLTHLLKNSLGGNAKTVMIAAISPSCVNYDETMSTLRYADRAKKIKNKAVVNEDPNQKLIRGLKDEIEQLRALLAAGGAQGAIRPGTAEVRRIREDVEENERLLRDAEQSWEDRLKQSQDHLQSNNAVFARMGVTVDASKTSSTPHMMNLNQDPQMSGVLTYFFEEGLTRIGRADAEEPQQIVLSGLSILKEHCTITSIDSKLTVEILGDARVFVNGKPVKRDEPLELNHTDRIVFGNNHVYLVVNPAQMDARPYDQEVRTELLSKYTWEHAMNQLNESKMSTLTDGERKAREKAEMEAKAMQEKVKALEQRMIEERKKAEEEARAATDAEREKMMEKQKQLEEALQRQIDRTNRKQARREQERRKRAILEDNILRTLPLISEANAISEELSKNKEFSIQLVATQNGSTKPEEDEDDGEDEDCDNDSNNPIASGFDTSIWIRIITPGEEIPMMWDYEKFVNRLYLMREMYEDFVESGRNMEEINDIYGTEYDPFYDPNTEQMIGKAYVILAPLSFFINVVEESVPIVQYQGKTDGALHVSISLDEDQIAQFDNFDIEEETTMADIIGKSLKFSITVHSAKGLPKKLANDMTVAYKFFTESQRTPPITQHTINPRFDHVHKFSVPVTPEFVQYIEKEPLEFQVWGSLKKEENRNKSGNEKSSLLKHTSEDEEEDAPLHEEKSMCNDDNGDDDVEGKTNDTLGKKTSPKSKKKETKQKKHKHKKKVLIVDTPPKKPGSPKPPGSPMSPEELESKVQELTAMHNNVEEKAKELESSLKEKETENLELKDNREKMETKTKELEDKIKSLEQELTQKNDALKELEEKTKMLQFTVESQNSNNKNSSSTCSMQ